MDRLLSERAVDLGQRFGFTVEYSSAEFAPAPAGFAPLLEVHYCEGSGAATNNHAALAVPLPALGTVSRERWLIPHRVERTRCGTFQLSEGGGLLAGSALVDGVAVEQETRALYAEMLGLIALRGYHLLRVWNVVPRLHERNGSLDRYMLFSRGRAEAFEANWGPDFAQRLCAFSAVGSRMGPQVLYFLASREAGQPLENPRQMPAWNYPLCYGPRSPSFARGTIAKAPFPGLVFVSGTASIVGHESLHPGDIVQQTHETLRNVESLLRGAAASSSGPKQGHFAPIKVFLTRPSDLNRVQELLENALGPRVPTLYVQADICRAELLVEIEGLGQR